MLLKGFTFHNAVKYIGSSSARLAKFREFSVLEKLNNNANVPMDNCTRWNATYLMSVAALKFSRSLIGCLMRFAVH